MARNYATQLSMQCAVVMVFAIIDGVRLMATFATVPSYATSPLYRIWGDVALVYCLMSAAVLVAIRIRCHSARTAAVFLRGIAVAGAALSIGQPLMALCATKPGEQRLLALLFDHANAGVAGIAVFILCAILSRRLGNAGR